MNLELERCPCCGEDATILVLGTGVKVVCIGCGIQTEPEIDGKDHRGALFSVVEKWNRRTPKPC